MGSEGKSRKRRSSPVSSQDEDERSKKHRKRDDRKSGRDDEKKERKKKSEKSHKHSKSRDEKEKKSKGKHKHRKKHLDSFKELSKDDYFSKNKEFSTWLKEEKGIYFSDLSSESARDLFSGFVKAWNNQRLESHYYEGVSNAPRTSHNWKIKA